jgi:hypothetical protein
MTIEWSAQPQQQRGPAERATAGDWERMWAPYDETTYRQVLAWLGPQDVVLDIGAGDLRLSRRMAARSNRVYAIERNRELATPASPTFVNENLTVIWGDAYQVPFPAGITVAVLLMRHCLGLPALLNKLDYVGCQRLITNARWRVGLELINLQRPAIPYPAAGLGWYACRCGATGFIAGPAEALTPQIESAVQEVVACPACQ